MFSSSAANHLERTDRHSMAWSHLPEPIVLFEGPSLYFGQWTNSVLPTTPITQEPENASVSQDSSDDIYSLTAPTTSSDSTTTGSSSMTVKKPNLTDEQRRSLLCFLLQRIDAARLKRGALSAASRKYNVTQRTCQRIVHRYLTTGDVASLRRDNCGRRKLPDDWFERIRSVPKRQRKNLRSLSEASGISRGTLHRAVKDGVIKVKNSSVSPFLTPTNRLQRISFVLSNVDKDGMMNDFYQYIHIDEKWFYIAKEQQRYYLLPDEDTPYRTCKSKRFITKVMFLCAVARPRFCTTEKKWFDGLLGVWPFTTKEPARRNSKNRKKGTLVTKPLASIDAAAYKEMMIENVLPAIYDRWPASYKKKPIILQEDNCRVHTPATRVLVNQKANEEGFAIEVWPQPPNSPDFNVLDLGFFHSIQALKDRTDPKDIDELISVVENAYWKQPRETLDNVFLSLQGTMIDSLSVDGSNSYQLRHMGKAKLRRQGTLPVSLKCDAALIARAREVMDEPACLTATEPSRFKALGVIDLSRRSTSPSNPLVVEEI